MIKFVFCLFWLIIVPTILGAIITRKMEKYKNSIILSWILGYFIEFALFELLSIPIGLVTTNYSLLFYSWIIIVLIIFIVSIILNYKRIKEIWNVNIENIKKLPIVLTLIASLLIGIQMYIPFRYMYIDDDDSNFVAKATLTYETNTLYKYNDKGDVSEQSDLRHELATFPIYTATISKLIDIHPAITAHTIFPVIFICLAYMVYVLIADSLFNGDKKKNATFIIVLAIIYIFGGYSRYANFVRLLYRSWQGKSLLANIAIPTLWLLYSEYSKNERKNIYWIAIIITILGACVLTTMSVVIMSITLLALTIVFSIKDKKITDFLKSLISVSPCLILRNIIFGFRIGGKMI